MDTEKKSNGAIVGLVIIIIILVLGGLYSWQRNEKIEKERKLQMERISAQDAADLEALQAAASSTNTDLGIDTGNLK